VYTRWVTDSGRYNEICNPIDYETEDALAEQERLGLVLPQPAAAAAGLSLAQSLCRGVSCDSVGRAVPCGPANSSVRISVAPWHTLPLMRAAGAQLKAAQRARLAQPRLRRPPVPAGSPARSARAWTLRRTRPGLLQEVSPCLAKLCMHGPERVLRQRRRQAHRAVTVPALQGTRALR